MGITHEAIDEGRGQPRIRKDLRPISDLPRPIDPIMERTVARIERELHAPGSGVHRHLEDVYYGGGVWVLLALWSAWYYLEIGDAQSADELIAWSENQAGSNYHLPEQVNTVMLAPGSYYDDWVKRRGRIANPLLRTHTKYLIVQTVRSRLLRVRIHSCSLT